MDAGQKLEVHELLGRAAHGYDARDVDMLTACFATDARMVIRITDQATVGPFNGRDAIMGLMRQSMETQTDARRHVITNIFFEECGETRARVVSDLSLFATEGGRARLLCTGVYRDVVVRSGGRWVIADRDLYLDSAY
jgi:3-phenylpropionate/cinnamic acid dioxygenase small subunit